MPPRLELSRRPTEPPATKFQLHILKAYPLLLPTNATFDKYEGFVSVKGFCFRVSIGVPHYPSIHEISISCSWELKELLSAHPDAFPKILETSTTFLEFLDQLHHFVEKAIDIDRPSLSALKGDYKMYEEQVGSLKHCSTVLFELQVVGTKHLQYLSSDFRTITLGTDDSDGKINSLTLKVRPLFTDSSSGKTCLDVVSTDLPDCIIKEIEKETCISGAFNKFRIVLGTLSPLWASLALIDKYCWVIDPKHPKKADMYRRISISSRVMAQISWNPLQPHQKPGIKFQGADAEVDMLRSTYEKHLEEWSADSDILRNLCSVFSLNALPTPPDSERHVAQAVDTGECCICYDVLLNGKLPEESCGKCLNNFHAACLYEWLEMMPGSRQVHGHITGPCPNCENIIKCPCPHAIV